MDRKRTQNRHGSKSPPPSWHLAAIIGIRWPMLWRELLVGALFLGSVCTGLGAEESNPPHNEDFDHSPAELDAFVSEHTAGYQAEGKPSIVKLESFAPLELRLSRGRCYVMVARLGEHA